MDLRSQLGKPVLFHWVGWHGKDGVSIPGYDSRDPLVIGAQLDAMRAYGGDGFGVVALTFGPTVSTFIHAAVMEMCQQCNERNVPFAIMFDPWTVKNSSDKNAAMIEAIKHPDTQMMLNSRCYLAGKPVLDFSTGVNPININTAKFGIQYWMEQVNYSWPNTVETIPTLAVVQALPTMKLPCVMKQFNDGTGLDHNKSASNGGPVRIVPSFGGKTFWDTAALVPKLSQYIQYVTFNDYKEGTECEPEAVMLSRRIQ